MILKGRLVACGKVTDLLHQGTHHQVELVVDSLTPEGLDHLRPLVDKVVMQGDRMLVVLKNQQQVAGALEIIRAAKASLVSLNPQKGSLEDLFIREVAGHQSPSEDRA
jgi:ABC-2 type transport system ATP-binding protein